MSIVQTITVAPYSYERRRLLRTYLRKIKGRPRRVRVNVYETIIVEVPGYTYERVLRVRLVPRRKVVPSYQVTQAQARDEQLEAIRLGLAEAPAVRRAPAEEWKPVAQYQKEVEALVESTYDLTLVETDMEIFHASPSSDQIETSTLFVWPKKKLPLRLDLSKKYGKRGKTPFAMVRVWFWIRYDNTKEWAIGCRTMTVPLTTWDGLRKKADALFESVRDEQGYDPTNKEKKSAVDWYHRNAWTPQELIAWTGYLIGEKAVRKSRRLGGSA